MPSTSGMKGDGFYDANSSGQRAAIEALLSWIDEAAERLALPEVGRPLTIADYGSSEGSNALRAMRQAITALRRRGAAHPIWAVFSDLSTNNFNQLFANLARAKALPAAEDGVFSAAIGGSFYESLLPPATVQLAMSFNAVLWLDHLPAEPLENFVVYLGPRSHRADIRVPPTVAQAFARLAKGNLEQFLRCRAGELAPGGRLLVSQPGSNQEYCTGEGLYDLVHDACLDLISAGRLDRAAYAKVTIPIYFRTVEEMLAPVDDITGPLRDAFAVERAETQEVAVPFAVEYEQSGDLATYVKRYVGFAQAFTEPILRGVLDSAYGPELVPAIYERMKERLAAEPGRYAFRYLQTILLLAKR